MVSLRLIVLVHVRRACHTWSNFLFDLCSCRLVQRTYCIRHRRKSCPTQWLDGLAMAVPCRRRGRLMLLFNLLLPSTNSRKRTLSVYEDRKRACYPPKLTHIQPCGCQTAPKIAPYASRWSPILASDCYLFIYHSCAGSLTNFLPAIINVRVGSSNYQNPHISVN